MFISTFDISSSSVSLISSSVSSSKIHSMSQAPPFHATRIARSFKPTNLSMNSSIFWYKVTLQLQLSISRTFDSVNVCTNSPTLTSKRNSVRLMKQKKRDDNSMNYKSVLSLWQDSLFRLSGSSDPRSQDWPFHATSTAL